MLQAQAVGKPHPLIIALLEGVVSDTLGIMAKTVGASNFQPIAEECALLGLVGLCGLILLLMSPLFSLSLHILCSVFSLLSLSISSLPLSQSLMNSTDPDLRRSV